MVGVKTSSLSLDSSDQTIESLEEDLSEAARFGLELDDDSRCNIRRRSGWMCESVDGWDDWDGVSDVVAYEWMGGRGNDIAAVVVVSHLRVQLYRHIMWGIEHTEDCTWRFYLIPLM